MKSSDRYAVPLYVVVVQYGSEAESLSSDAGDIATTICSSVDEIMTAAAGRGTSISCCDSGAVGGVGVAVTGVSAIDNSVTSRDLWCSGGRCGMADIKPVGTWSSNSNSEDLAELFSRIGLGKYTDIFQQQEVSEYH